MHPKSSFALHSLISILIACTLSAGPALAAPGDLLVSDYSTDNVRLFDSLSGDDLGELVSAGAGGLRGPWDATFGPDGNLYVVSSRTAQILRYEGATGAFIDVFAAANGLGGPIGAVFGPDGNLYVSGASNPQIRRYDGTTGAFMGPFTSGATLRVARGLTFGPDGNLYATHFDNNVQRYDGQTGAFIDHFVSTGSGGLSTPGDLAFGPDGNLYVASRDSGSILRYDGGTGQFMDAFAFAASPVGLAFGPDGDLYVSDIDLDAREVSRYDGQTGAFIEVFASGFMTPTFLTFVPEGDSTESDKVCICHVPRGKPDRAHTICVAPAALPAHLAHGDDPNPCSSSNGSSNGHIDARGWRRGEAMDATSFSTGSSEGSNRRAWRALQPARGAGRELDELPEEDPRCRAD